MRLFACLLPLSLLLAGCAGNSVFVPYPARALQYTQALGTGNLDPAVKAADQQRKGKDQLLALLEQGRLTQLAGDTTQSRQLFAQADAQLRSIDERATLSLSHTADQGVALLSNDNAIAYQSTPYERIFLHQFQALNYVAAHDREGALVEMRRAQSLQDQARDDHASENLDAPANSPVTNRSDSTASLPNGALARYQQDFGNLDDLAGRVSSSVQNAASFYLAALLYEADGKRDDAYIDLRRALSLSPANTVLQAETLRLAQRLQRRDDLPALRAVKAMPEPKAQEGAVVVWYEEGVAPPKRELFLPFPWPEAWYVLAIPYYPQAWIAPQPLRISGSTLQTPLLSQPVTDVQALAGRALRDQLPVILLRQTLRAQSKHKLQQQGQQGGDLLGLLVGAYNLFSESADLRSWLTLPRFVHIARLNLPVGEQTLMLDGTQSVRLSVSHDYTTLVRVVRIDQHYYVANWPL